MHRYFRFINKYLFIFFQTIFCCHCWSESHPTVMYVRHMKYNIIQPSFRHLFVCSIWNWNSFIDSDALAAQEIINIFACFVCYANLQSLHNLVLVLRFSLVFGLRTALTDWSCGGTHKQNHNNLHKFKYIDSMD